MLAFTCVALLLALLGLAPLPAAAQDAQALRRELDQVKKQFETMQQEYLKTIESLSQRIERLESRPPTPSAAPVTPPVTAQPAPPGPPSLVDLARPRQPFGLYQQRGAGQLLFDMGIAGDFVGNITQHNVEKAQGGTFPGQENRFFPREVELSLFGQIDPYASAVVRIEAGEEERGGEIGVNLAEAYVTLLTLPFGTQARFGLVRNRFGYSNEFHEHDLPWIDRSNVLRNFFGGEGLNEKGVEVTFVPELPFYVEALAGVFNGDNETAFGRTSLQAPLVTGRLRTFLELGNEHALQLGMSVASGQTSERLSSTILGWEGRYKYRPEGWLHPLVTVTGEALYSLRQFNVDVDADGDGVTDSLDRKRKNRWGWYLASEVQPWRRWAAGLRFDWSQYPENPGAERSIEPYVSFWPSEFLRLRLAYKNTERTHRDGFDLSGGSARKVDEVLFQASFILGAHPAHPF